MSNGNADPKIIDLLKEKKNGDKPHISIEFFPPRTEVGVKVRISLMFPWARFRIEFLIANLSSIFRRIFMLVWSV